MSSLNSVTNKDILWNIIITQDSWMTHLIASIYRLFDKKSSKMKTFYHVDCYTEKELDHIKATEQFKRLVLFRHSRIGHYQQLKKEVKTDDLLYVFSEIETLILRLNYPLTKKEKEIKNSTKELIKHIISYKNIDNERSKNDIF